MNEILPDPFKMTVEPAGSLSKTPSVLFRSQLPETVIVELCALKVAVAVKAPSPSPIVTLPFTVSAKFEADVSNVAAAAAVLLPIFRLFATAAVVNVTVLPSQIVTFVAATGDAKVAGCAPPQAEPDQ
ncbi:MAG: hypothetical protein KDK41_04165, partial [Leptospiraceae bacterium]|nr:hypothetical protein [Leptospiraceae bacterium]